MNPVRNFVLKISKNGISNEVNPVRNFVKKDSKSDISNGVKGINFTKMVASGNDFVIIKNQKTKFKNLKDLAKKICDRRYGIGADGLLLLEKSKISNIKMRIFNSDGTEAEMCGNGIRCVALYSANNQKKVKIETKAGIIQTELNRNNIKVKMPQPKDLELNIPIKINNRLLNVHFVNIGVPHTVIFVEDLKKIDVLNLGRRIRRHKSFQPEGTNVDFIEILNENSLKIRTYERGVENETLSCGTGAVASAVISYKLQVISYRKINIQTKSGETLKVYLDNIQDTLKDIWLEGKAEVVYRGVYYVK